jgi:hypothetical protein
MFTAMVVPILFYITLKYVSLKSFEHILHLKYIDLRQNYILVWRYINLFSIKFALPYIRLFIKVLISHIWDYHNIKYLGNCFWSTQWFSNTLRYNCFHYLLKLDLCMSFYENDFLYHTWRHIRSSLTIVPIDHRLNNLCWYVKG